MEEEGEDAYKDEDDDKIKKEEKKRKKHRQKKKKKKEKGKKENKQNKNVASKTFNSYLGTKWCGKGNIADQDDDLGVYPLEDSCCRAHDNCPDYILAGETKHNVTNQRSYTV